MHTPFTNNNRGLPMFGLISKVLHVPRELHRMFLCATTRCIVLVRYPDNNYRTISSTFAYIRIKYAIWRDFSVIVKISWLSLVITTSDFYLTKRLLFTVMFYVTWKVKYNLCIAYLRSIDNIINKFRHQYSIIYK